MSSRKQNRYIKDNEFYRLIPPLSEKEKKQLERELLHDECKNPMIIWRNIIIDGYDHYDICRRHKVPLNRQYIDFPSREDAIIWSCYRQLDNRKMPVEYQRYLIGKIYLTDKQIRMRIMNEQQSESNRLHNTTSSVQSIAKSLEDKYYISNATVYRYGVYAGAIDEIAKKNTDIARIILSGEIAIAHKTLLEIARLSGEKLRKLKNLFANPETETIRSGDILLELQWHKRYSAEEKESKKVQAEQAATAEIKQMPVFDPDAEISSLTLTIPSWISSITRAFKATDLSKITPLARRKLQRQLLELNNTINQYLISITEKHNE